MYKEDLAFNNLQCLFCFVFLRPQLSFLIISSFLINFWRKYQLMTDGHSISLQFHRVTVNNDCIQQFEFFKLRWLLIPKNLGNFDNNNEEK